MPLTWPTRYVDEVLDYKIDWTERLAGDTIVTAETGVVSGSVLIESDSSDATSQTVWLSGGTPAGVSQVRCTIITADARTMEEIVTIRCF